MTLRSSAALLAALSLGACGAPEDPAPSATTASALSPNSTIGINVLLNTPLTQAIRADLGTHGTLTAELSEIQAVAMRAKASELPAIQALPYVAAAGPDAERKAAPIDTVSATNFAAGLSTWDQDALNVTAAPGSTARAVAQDGTGVYVAVLDTGLLDTWRQYFPQERIASEFGISFHGGGMEQGNVSSQPNVWEHDQNSHGTHVTSTILGYSFGGAPINGTAPKATVIPVKVLGQSGSGWSSMVAQGILYVTHLKESGQLGNSPVVINMSLGGPALEPVEKAAVDYAVARGVILVASAGNEGNAGMGYPGAYAPVISVAASGWVGEWTTCAGSTSPNAWWRQCDVAEPTAAADFYIAEFSSRAKAGQDLDVAAPGSWVVGPYQLQSGTISYYFLGGTSMASPHVAGIAALMLQKNANLTQSQVESILESTAIPLSAGCRQVVPEPGLAPASVCWGADATGAGLATADAALAAVNAPVALTGGAKKK